MNPAGHFLNASAARLLYIKSLGDGVLKQLTEAQLFHRVDDQSNSVAIIVQHLHGNMLSRWTDFLTSDGDKTWRRRDQEFEPTAKSQEEIRDLWEAGWKLTVDTVRALSTDDVMRTITIRAEPMTAMDAIIRQTAHYSYHVGQMVTLARQQLGRHWKTLSIARGKSKDYTPVERAGGIRE